jgi:hypothetical protein
MTPPPDGLRKGLSPRRINEARKARSSAKLTLRSSIWCHSGRKHISSLWQVLDTYFGETTLNTRAESQTSRPAIGGVRSRKFFPIALVALLAFSAAGCGGSDSQIDRKPIFGKILGAEGRSGMLTFTPQDSSLGPSVSGDFEDGVYQFTNQYGPVPGEYDVSIEFEENEASPKRAPNRTGRVIKDPRDVGRVAYEEDKWTTASVPAEGPFEVDLDLTEAGTQ